MFSFRTPQNPEEARRKREQRRRKLLKKKTRRKLTLESLETREVFDATPLLIDLNPSGQSSPSDFVGVGNIAFFVADDGSRGKELWKTDGTTAGTFLVKDINPGTTGSAPANLINLNGTLYFTANDGTNGIELWKSDGTAAGTVMITDIFTGQDTSGTTPAPQSSSPTNLTEFNGKLYFSAMSASGRELWVSDGTAAGTTQLKDIFTGNNASNVSNSSNPSSLKVANGTLYFAAQDNANGIELWKTDGTTAGTVLVKDIASGSTNSTPKSSNPTELTNVNGTLFFAANDGTNGIELWKSDGTATGTVMVQDIYTGTTTSSGATVPNSSQPLVLTEVGGKLFFTAIDAARGQELWKSDGTAAGTVLVKDINPGTQGNLAYFSGFMNLNGTLIFSANDGVNGRELWKSDGTEAGTVMIKDLHTGNSSTGSGNSSYPYYMKNINGTLFFTASNSTTGRELWRTDGTAGGTVALSEIAPGTAGAAPEDFTNVNGKLVFAASNGTARELYSMALEGENDVVTARVTIYVDGQQVSIPTNVGVASSGTKASVYSSDANGTLSFTEGTAPTLGDFFSTWRTNAGIAGNNTNAIFSATQLFGSTTNTTKTLQMFVNGQISKLYNNQALKSGDQIVLVYGADPVLSLNTNYGSMIVQLYGEQTPQTVANFLTYVNSGAYTNTFFHRSVSNFVIQAGGFKTSSNTFTNTSQFSTITTNPPVVNEPGISNLRGTIAMAKLSGNPNSATSQFFVNLNDTNSSLDSAANNAFTVFGKVLDMTPVNSIAALTINKTNPSPYNELPLGANNQLAVIQSITGQGDITGTKFNDTNSNGVMDSGESGISGITIYVDANNNGTFDSGEVSTVTDSSGKYMLQMTPGTYTVRANNSTGKVTTLPASPGSYTVTVQLGIEASGKNFGESTTATSNTPPTATADTFNVANTGVGQTLNVLANDKGISGTSAGLSVTSVTQGSAGGTLVLNNGVVTYTPKSGYVGNETFTYAVQDSNGQSSTGTASITVQSSTSTTDNSLSGYAYIDVNQNGVKDAGEAGIPGVLITLTSSTSSFTTRTILTSDDGSYSFTGLPTDTYQIAESQPNAFYDGIDSTNATNAIVGADQITNIVLGNGQSFDANNFGEADIEPMYVNITWFFASSASSTQLLRQAVAVGEERAGNASLAAQIRAGGSSPGTGTTNQNPVATADSYSVTAGQTLTTTTTNGVLANDSDPNGTVLTAQLVTNVTKGALTLNANGTFTYTPNSGATGSDTFTYVANDGSLSSSTTTVTINITSTTNTAPVAVANTYTGSPNTTLSISQANGVLTNDTDADGNTLTANLVSTTTNGSLSLNSNGSFTYTPNSNFRGTDTFTYQANDGTANSAVTTVTLVINSPPTAVADSYTTTEDTTLTIGTSNGVLANDTDVNSDTLTSAVVTNPGHGILTLNSNGSFTYVPTAGYSGADSFTYKANDGLADSNIVTVSLTVTAVNDAPVSVADSYTVAAGATLNVPAGQGLLANDTDADGNTLTAITASNPANGSLALDANGSFTYTPNSGFHGTDTFSYFANDGTANSTPVTVTIVVNSVPTVVADSYNVRKGESLTVNAANGVLSNDQDADSNTMTAILVSNVSNGTLTLNSNGSFTYTPTSTYSGTDTFTYKANDTFGDSTPITVTINVNEVSPAPVVANDSYTVGVNSTLSVNSDDGVLNNDVDPEDLTMTVTVVTPPTNGSLTMQANGAFVYVPHADYHGFDTFTYTSGNGSSTSTAATVTITVNSLPTGSTDTYNASTGTQLTIDSASGVLDNDFDADGDTLTATIHTEPAHGEVTLNTDGSFTYTSDAGYTGVDTFKYTANDGFGNSADIIVTINVTQPTAQNVPNKEFDVETGDVLQVNAGNGLLNGLTSTGGGTLTAQLDDNATNGVAVVNSDGSFTYTPNSTFHGTDSFTYIVLQGSNPVYTGTVVVTVNTLPTVTADGYSVNQDETLTVNELAGVLMNDTDPDNDVLAANLEDDATHGLVAMNADGSFTYVPDAGFTGVDTFSYRVNDGYGNSEIAIVTITVNPVSGEGEFAAIQAANGGEGEGGTSIFNANLATEEARLYASVADKLFSGNDDWLLG